MILLLLIVISTDHSEEPEYPDFAKTPIFFVHGYGMKASCWKYIISNLKKSGYPDLYLRTIQLVPDTGGNITAAENQIAPAIKEFLININTFIKNEGLNISLKKKVDLISHSMGALSARWYAAKIRPDMVRIWLSLAGANHGSDILCKYSGQGAKDCCPAFAMNEQESYIQYVLNGAPIEDIDETPFGLGKDSRGIHSIPPDEKRSILYITIRTNPDKWLKPEESAILDGAGGAKFTLPKYMPTKETSPGNILMLNKVGHDALLGDPVVFKIINKCLKSA